jgi:hypothetical protein
MVIHAGFNRREPVTYSDIMTELGLEYGVCLLPDPLRRIRHRIPRCKTIEGVPQEVLRVQCGEGEIDRHYDSFEKTLARVPSAAIVISDFGSPW